MKILLINNAYPTKAKPKRASYIRTIYNNLKQIDKFKVDLLILDSDANYFISYLKFYWRLLFYKMYNQYDLVYIHHYSFIFLPLLAHLGKMKKIVLHWHGADLIPKSVAAKIICPIAEKFIYEDFYHMVPSKYFQDLLVKRLGINRKTVFISPSGGVDTDLFSPQRGKGKSKNVVTIGYASELVVNKGIGLFDRLVKDKEKLEKETKKEIKFACINFGREADKYIDSFSKLSYMKIWAPMSKEKMPEFYSFLDLYVFPTFSESLGLVGLEAMSCGVPVVGTDGFSLKEYIKPGLTGERFKVNNYQAFKNSVVKAINHLSKYKTRQFVVDNYSQQAVIKDYKRVFNKIVV